MYTQHTPLLVNTLESLLKGRLKESEYPSMSPPLNGTSGPVKPPRLVIVFVMGGTTYEEAKAVADLNLQVGSQNPAAYDSHLPRLGNFLKS